MRFLVEIQCDHAAFADDPNHEVVRLLREIGKRLEKDGESCGGLVDVNGNSCGSYKYEA
jgi:hypothetical protein